MYRYVLTERGKFLVAILVIVFFIIPLAIIATWALTRDTTSTGSPNDSNGFHQNGTGPEILEPSTEQPQVPQDGDANGTAPHDPPLTGTINFDLNAGAMTFLFTPGQQSALDDDTASKIGELLTSPKNTLEAKIAAEIPQLSDNETAILTSAILDVFNTLEVPLSDIVFFVYQPEPGTKTFEVSISFQ